MKKLLFSCCFLLLCIGDADAIERVHFQIIGVSGFDDLVLMNIKVQCYHIIDDMSLSSSKYEEIAGRILNN